MTTSMASLGEASLLQVCRQHLQGLLSILTCPSETLQRSYANVDSRFSEVSDQKVGERPRYINHCCYSAGSVSSSQNAVGVLMNDHQ